MSSVKLSQTDNQVRQFFDRYYTEPLSYPASDVDAVVGFFEKRGFANAAAVSVSVVLLQQAKLDNVRVFALLDTLKGLSDIQISFVVAEILNFNRSKTSVLGLKNPPAPDNAEARNIVF